MPTRVQSSGKIITAGTTINIPFSTPPTVGNAIVVSVISYNSPLTLATAVDNKGNAYTLDVNASNPSSNVAIFSCAKVVNTGAGFVVTVNKPGGGDFLGSADEVGGITGNLGLDKTSTATGNSTTPATGSTPACGGTNLFVTAVMCIAASQGFITVQTVSPAWTEVWEHLSFGQMPGEVDARILPSAAGTTQSCAWTVATATVWCAAIAVYADESEFPPPPVRVTQDVIELISQPPVSARITQDTIELISAPAVDPRITQYLVELITSFTPTPPPVGVIGINFRNTYTYIADGILQTFCVGDLYPFSRKGFTYGWDVSLNSVDRATALGPELAGINYFGATRTFRLDLPNPGVYTIRMAIGDRFFNQGPQQVTIKDNTTTLAVITGTVTADQFIDASGVVRTAANWGALNVGVNFTFASTIARFQMDPVGGGLPVIAHISVSLVPAGSGPGETVRFALII